MDWILLMGAINALWIVGVWNAALPGQVLDPIATWMAGNSKVTPPIEGHLPDWINKPTILCPMCMASFHGILWWCLFIRESWHLLPFYVVCLSGLMKVLTILVLNKDEH
jgi:hypothetical protein